MWVCGLTSLVVCINEKNHDIRERNVTIRSEIWAMNIHSLGFRDIRECVALWRLILWRLGYKTHAFTISSMIWNWTPMTSYFHGDMPCRGRGEEGTNLDLYILVYSYLTIHIINTWLLWMIVNSRLCTQTYTCKHTHSTYIKGLWRIM